MWCPGCRSSYFQVKDYKSKVMRLKSLWCDVNTLSELSRELWFLFIPHSFRHSFCVPTDELNIIFITQWTKMRKHNERVWIKHPMMQNIYCMQEELRFVFLAHKKFCIEKSSDPEYNEQCEFIEAWLSRLKFLLSTEYFHNKKSGGNTLLCVNNSSSFFEYYH